MSIRGNNAADVTLSKSALGTISMPFAFYYAVRFYAYCVFRYFGFYSISPQRT